MTITLKATDLTRKNGFGDGDLLDDLLEGAGYDVLAENVTSAESANRQFFGHAVLTAVIRSYLMPKLVDFELLEQVSRMHNPMRIRGNGTDTQIFNEALDGVTVTVSKDEVLEIADLLAIDFPGATPTAGRAALL